MSTSTIYIYDRRGGCHPRTSLVHWQRRSGRHSQNRSLETVDERPPVLQNDPLEVIDGIRYQPITVPPADENPSRPQVSNMRIDFPAPITR
jgi:hypothetical protein